MYIARYSDQNIFLLSRHGRRLVRFSQPGPDVLGRDFWFGECQASIDGSLVADMHQNAARTTFRSVKRE